MELLEIFVFIGSIMLCFTAAAIGSYFTEQSLDSWYAKLAKPPMTPPDWVFPVVWSVLYFMMGTALAMVLTEGRSGQIMMPVLLFFLQLGLNVGWSAVFFGQRNPLGAFFTMSLLWCVVAITTLSFAVVTFEAGLLMLPYLMWISFALILNYNFLKLNKV